MEAPAPGGGGCVSGAAVAKAYRASKVQARPIVYKLASRN